MAARAPRTTSARTTSGTRSRSLLHRGSATVEVLYVGPDCVRVSVTRAPRGRPAPAAVAVHPDPPGAADLEPHVRAVLDASAESHGTLFDALASRLGDDVAGIALEQNGGSVVVTLDLLPTRRGRRRAPGVPRPRTPVHAR
jgi:hypothetical protein